MTESHFGASTQQNLTIVAASAPIHTIPRTARLHRPVHAQQPDGREGARDQDVDAGVVDATHPDPGARLPHDAVVERARGEHQRDRSGERGGPDGLASAVGERDQERPDDERGPEADLVKDAAQDRPLGYREAAHSRNGTPDPGMLRRKDRERRCRDPRA